MVLVVHKLVSEVQQNITRAAVERLFTQAASILTPSIHTSDTTTTVINVSLITNTELMLQPSSTAKRTTIICNNTTYKMSMSSVVKEKVKEADLYSAFIEVPYTQGAQVRIT